MFEKLAQVGNVGSRRLCKSNIPLLFKVASIVLTVMFNHHTQANEAHHGILAMGDLGALRSGFSSNQNATSTTLSWNQLSHDQKKILSALGGEWDTLRPWQREKMLDIARDYPSMDTEKQLRIQRRLIAWSRMTPYERDNARKRYQQFQQLSPEHKEELRKKWAEHKKDHSNAWDWDDEDIAFSADN